VYEETLSGRPHDTSVQKATSKNENVNAVKHHVQNAIKSPAAECRHLINIVWRYACIHPFALGLVILVISGFTAAGETSSAMPLTKGPHKTVIVTTS